MNRLSFFILALFPFLNLAAQEVIVPVSGNESAKEFYQNFKKSSKKNISFDTLYLPFIDDFSDSEVLPNPNKWSDSTSYINNRYSNTGVTTMRAMVNAFGMCFMFLGRF